MKGWITTLFELPALTQQGHFQSVADANLGLGWIYYALPATLSDADRVRIAEATLRIEIVPYKASATVPTFAQSGTERAYSYHG